jgi:high affinity Mn2+ porin
MSERRKTRIALVPVAAAILLVPQVGPLAAADLTAVPLKAPAIPQAYDWTGVYVGGYLGYAWGNSNWTTAPDVSGSLNLTQRIDPFDEAGSFFAGLQFGYDYMLPNRIVIGAVADATFPSFQNLAGISIGGTSTFNSPTNRPESYSETMLSSGTVRARVGYAPGNWLFYGTGGFAWTYDQLTLTQLVTGTTDTPFLWRFGWAAGAGVEFPVAPHWTANLEYLITDYPHSNVLFANNGQSFNSNWSLQEVLAGLNYRFGGDAVPEAPATSNADLIKFHGQTTLTCKAILPSDRPMRAPTACPVAEWAARPPTRRCLSACGYGRVPSCGSTRRSIRATV